jgi:hypothetical protein
MVGKESELVLAMGIVGLERLPKEDDIFLFAVGLEGQRKVI